MRSGTLTTIDARSPVPKYFQLREILLDLIENELTVDAPVPSERELAARYGERFLPPESLVAKAGRGEQY